MSYWLSVGGLTAAMRGTRVHKTSRQDEMVRDPRVWDETLLIHLETVLRPRRRDRDHIPGR